MKLEDQVCSLELAKKLKELGVKQGSAFWWLEYHDGWKLQTTEMNAPKGNPHWLPAFAVAELGEMLPWQLIVGAHRYELDLFKNGEVPAHWSVGYTTKDEEIYSVLGMNYQFSETEADARANMLIYLLENSLVKA